MMSRTGHPGGRTLVDGLRNVGRRLDHRWGDHRRLVELRDRAGGTSVLSMTRDLPLGATIAPTAGPPML